MPDNQTHYLIEIRNSRYNEYQSIEFTTSSSLSKVDTFYQESNSGRSHKAPRRGPHYFNI